MSPWKLALDTKLRFFQYNFVHRRIVTNVKCAKWDKDKDRASCWPFRPRLIGSPWSQMANIS